uniref:Arginyl-tRNA--protein transferase 1 n=2 Tax=Clastoptera arizonana TaxID=38151 RepID=A0A1B6E864_9HEMI
MAVTNPEGFSIVDYYSENESDKCGYCKSKASRMSCGMWAHSLTVQDYQDMIDRGWRRSGRYCYKPKMNKTCCPMYTIKCAALDFKLSKSQKKVLKRVNRFLNGDLNKVKSDMELNSKDVTIESELNIINDGIQMNYAIKKTSFDTKLAKVSSVEGIESAKGVEIIDKSNQIPPSTSSNISDDSAIGNGSLTPKIQRKIPRAGSGADMSLPRCKKAKLLRKEKKLKKLSESNEDDTSYKVQPVAKSLEDFLDECLTDTPAHRLEMVLVSVSSPEMKETLQKSWAVYSKYQQTIHNDSIDRCGVETYVNFLVNSPLEPWKPNDGPPQGYGSFHQQYWLDGKLIAVGVIDILPSCVSSVYFFYDPDYSFLTLGTYGSLREVSFTRSLHHRAPKLRYYYMGYYIHSCPKMRYKGSLVPSFLSCPEVFTWHPIEFCRPLLDQAKYCRFNQDPKATDPNDVTSIDEVLILWNNIAMPYKIYVQRSNKTDEADEVLEYAKLVGNICATRMLLLRA